MAEDLSGQRLDDYLLLNSLGKGTFGEVYLAEDMHQGIQVAVKILNAQIDEEHFDQLNDFLKEVRAFRFQHPNIVRIRDFGMVNGHSFLVMNYIPNGNLRQRHPSGTRLPWKQVVTYVQQVAEALQYIHDMRIVHRDVKPENTLVGPNDEILLSDFGIAVPSYTWDATRLQIPRGTPTYIAPEQYQGQAVRASDQYGLGIMMYEWLAGHPPFQGTINEVLHLHLTGTPPSLRGLGLGISARAEELIFRLLAKNPKERFASMREFLAALARAQTAFTLLKPIIFTKHSQGVRSVKWSPDGRYIASAGRDKTVWVWDPTTGAAIYDFHGHTDDIWCLSWSPDSRLIVSGGADKVAQVWEATTGYRRSVYHEHSDIVRAVAWSPDGTSIASADDDGIVCVWNTSTGNTLYRYHRHKESVSSIAWSTKGNMIASGGEEGEIHLWRAARGSSPKICQGHTDRVTSLDWSPDGTLLASASYDGTVCIWDVVTRHIKHTYTGHKDVVASVAWSPDGSLIASGSCDNTIHIWAVGETEARKIFRDHQSWVNALSWSSNGQHLVSGSWDRTARTFHAY